MFTVVRKKIRFLASLMTALMVVSMSLSASGIGVVEKIIQASTGPVRLGEWNERFSEGLEIANEQNIPMLVFFGGLSCGVCEMLQRACITDEFIEWQNRKKIVMIFNTDTLYGNSRKFAIPEGEGAIKSFPFIGIYWNRYGEAPEKNTQYYRSFCGREGVMPCTGGSLASQLIRSCELVMGEYPYAGGEFVVSASSGQRLEVESGYASDRRVSVPLTRAGDAAYVNRLVVGSRTNEVSWAAGETGSKEVQVELPAGLPAGTRVPLQLLTDTGAVHATAEIAVVAPQSNSLRNPAWLGEDFAAGEWTMDLDAALSRADAGEFDHVLVYFTGALWCPHCQGLEDSVLATSAFRTWCEENRIALVELDNPRRSSSTAEDDYGIREANGAPPTLLRYAAGANSYAGGQESGASYLSRKGIAVGDTKTARTAEWVLQRNRRLGYAWGEGTYCAPGAGRCGYPTMILLDADGKIAGRFNRLEGDSYVHDPVENMARLAELLKLANGDGEKANFAATTQRSLEVGAAAVETTFQINDRIEYLKLCGLPTGKVTFSAAGAPAGNPVTLSVVKLVNQVETTIASGTGELTVEFAGDADVLLRVEAFSDARTYGADSGFTLSVAASIVLVPTEKTSIFTPGDRLVRLAVEKGVKYRLEGIAAPASSVLRDDGAAAGGGRYYTALSTGEIQIQKAADTISYQVWTPGVVSFDIEKTTVFKFQGSGTVAVTRSRGGSGAVSTKICVVDGDAENGVRYVWDDATVLSWADGEVGTKRVTFSLKDTGSMMPNQDFVLGFRGIEGAAAEAVSDGRMTITLCDTDKPVLPKTDYDISMFSSFNALMALEPQQVFNVQDGKVSIKKTAGKLPAGVKLICQDGEVVLSGAAKKAGTYAYSFTLQQKQGGELKIGPEIELMLNVAEASDVASGGSAFLGRKLKATLPLYLSEGDTRLLKGVLEFSMTSKNKITAKYCGLSKKKVSFKGLWGTMSSGKADTGWLTAKTGQALRLLLDENGHLSAELDDPAYPEHLRSEELRIGVDSYATSFAGAYTASLIEVASDDPAGYGYLIVKSVTAAGKASWKSVLANGQTLAGTAYVMMDDEGCAVLPVFKFAAKDYVAASLRLRPNGTALIFPRAIMDCPNTLSRWEHTKVPMSVHDCKVRGSCYNKKGSALDICCYDQFFQTNLVLSAVLDGFKSGAFGVASDAVEGEVSVLPNAIKLSEKVKGLKLSFAKSTGVFKGSMSVKFAAKTLNAKFQGVVLPGWHDCGCEGPTDDQPFGIDVSLPFSLGAAWISDKVDGMSVKRGFPVKIDVKE